MKGKNNTKMTRLTKQETNFRSAPPLTAQNHKQQQYIDAIENCPIVVATGYPGTSKTYIPTRIGSLWLKNHGVDRIVLLRPAVSASESLGYAKGTHEEKMKHWLRPILSTLKEEFSPGMLSDYLREEVGKLDFCPMENVKGNSWNNTFIIVDEAEDCTFKEVLSLLTRVGHNSTLVLCGDVNQTDLPTSGLGQLLAYRSQNTRLENNIQHVHFGEYSDIVRSNICREIVMGIDELELWAG